MAAAAKSTTLPTFAATPVDFNSASGLHHTVTGVLLGTPDGHTGEILSRLVADAELACQLSLRRDTIVAGRDPKFAKGLLGYLGVIIYGPKHRLDDVGDFMTQCGCFLQDPVGCDRNVPYINPQCMFSMHGTPPTTFELSQPFENPVEDFTKTYSDILTGFETIDPLYETPTPVYLRTDLQSYVKVFWIGVFPA